MTAAAPAIGVFGGTFDPIHVAHLAVAEAARDALGLERVLFIPNRQPPHKPDQAVTPAADRLAMVQAAIADNPAFETSTIEIDREGPSYTADTLDGAAGGAARGGGVRRPGADPVGRGARRPRDLARAGSRPRTGHARRRATRRLAGHRRRDAIARLVPGADARVVVLDGPRMRLSASEIRSRAAAGRSLRYLVPDAVAAYIGDHGLYTEPRRMDRS